AVLLQICNYQKQEEGSYDCSTVDPSRPFCQNGVCIEESDCTTQIPNNCSEAVYCDNDLAGSIYTAPVPSYMFDFKYDTWVYYQSPSDCFEINCSIATNLNKFFAYKPHPQLYIYCGTSGPLTFQCGDNNVYNEETNACEFGCLKAGKFEIEGVKDKYYSCLAGPNGTEQYALRTLVPLSPRALTSCAAGRRQDCEDCNTVKICSYDLTPLTQYRCQDVDPSKPYCTGAGICSDVPDTNNICQKTSDLCPMNAPGFYPNPSNCSRYLYCDSNMLGTEQNCLAANNVYNQTTEACFLKRRTADCFQVDCNNSRNKDKWFVYDPFPQLYFVCSSNGPLMFKCPRETEVFDLELKRCEFQCRKAGRFAHPTNKYMYYECAYVSTSKLEKYEQTCPQLLQFDANVQKCVPVTSSGSNSE
uniref:Chitin-binding type-2 domain-containing protein n=1 Tax=Anopheles minimus TaxID=112268 RepID=A0A182W882_9DIPT